MPGMDHILNKAYLATGTNAFKQFQVVKQVAETTLQPAQCALYLHTDTVPVLGVIQEALDAAKTTTGKAFVGVALQGLSKVIVGVATNCAIGAYVIPSATVDGACDFLAGKLGSSGGTYIVGQVTGIKGNSIGQAVTAGDLVDIQIMAGDLLYLT
jgi:hypothetical protein